MNGLDTIRDCMTNFLREQGVCALTAWPDGARVAPDRAVAAVAVRKCEGGPSGFQDYLGERFNPDTQRWEELYGKQLTVTFGLDLYGGRAGGAADCQSAFDSLASAFQRGGPPGLNVQSFSQGEVKYEKDLGLFHCPVEAVCQCFLYAVADEGGQFLDFEIKGVRL